MCGEQINGEMMLLSGNASQALAANIAMHLDTTVGDAYIDHFIDGETSIKINEQVRDKDVFLVQSLCNARESEASINDTVVELCLTLDALCRSSAKRITAVVPYYGYARQDRKDKPRVPISARWVADAVEMSGADRILTFDLHADQIQGFFDRRFGVDHITAAPSIFIPHIRSMDIEDPVVASTDKGGDKYVTRFADLLGADMAYIHKERLNDQEVRIRAILGDVVGRNVIIVDDMCASGSTLQQAAIAYRNAGAKEIYSAATHGVFCGEAFKKIEDSPIKQMWVTDSIPQPDELPGNITVLSAAKLFGEAIKRIHQGGSISELYS